MSLFSRITGVLDSFQQIELERKDRYGAGGEDEVARILERNGYKYVRNPLVPHPSRPGAVLEADFLVHAGNALVVLEVKKLVGRINFVDMDRRFVCQEKEGRHGETLVIKRFSNPLHKINGFAHRLRNFLGSLDPRFQPVRIDAVVVFAPTADISAVHDPDAMIYTIELPDLLRRKGEVSKGGHKRWLVDALMYVPTWDRVETHQGDEIYGLFCQPVLEFTGSNGQRHRLSYRDIAEVRLEPGGFFADASEATIRTLRGETVQTRVARGELALDRFGVIQTHKLRNLKRIAPGVVRLRDGSWSNENGQAEASKMRPMAATAPSNR